MGNSRIPFQQYLNLGPFPLPKTYALQDANWNTTALVNTTGTVQERYTYTPFGQVTFRDASGSTLSGSAKDWIFLHQGGEKIAANDYEFRNRLYSPTLGRWLSNDPLGFEAGDQNWYRAIGNNPGNGLDPRGLFFQPLPPLVYHQIGTTTIISYSGNTPPVIISPVSTPPDFPIEIHPGNTGDSYYIFHPRSYFQHIRYGDKIVIISPNYGVQFVGPRPNLPQKQVVAPTPPANLLPPKIPPTLWAQPTAAPPGEDSPPRWILPTPPVGPQKKRSTYFSPEYTL